MECGNHTKLHRLFDTTLGYHFRRLVGDCVLTYVRIRSGKILPRH